ncbi:hypothetical protein EC973_004106 [Apophysomyces ossiformis]|uniref:PSP1 C-terminal domain-containing protein n=1 Tax=Apophysomyces ossiformis TaxID=679940 RepID=A0A8H7EKR3_9FUNG|nr:hypothetical protein EC973_004106 [Apophysomyces ossiformis]
MAQEPFDDIKHTHPLSIPPGLDQPKSINQNVLNNTTAIYRTKEDSHVGEDDGAWKAVGSPSRRESISTRMDDTRSDKYGQSISPLLHPADSDSHLSFTGLDKQWGSFGGLQWNRSSILSEDAVITRPSLSPSESKETFSGSTILHAPYDSVLSVPMLPSVPLEPTYRQQRSLSFSMGQDPAFFGYGDMNDGWYRNPLATMEEEQEDDTDINLFNGFHARSQSSGAIFGLSHPSSERYSFPLHRRRGSEQPIDHRRRQSVDIWSGSETSQASSYFPLSNPENDWRDPLQCMFSSYNSNDHSFTNQVNYNSIQKNTPVVATTAPATVAAEAAVSRRQSIQTVAEQLDATHLHRASSANTTLSSMIPHSHPFPMQKQPSSSINTPAMTASLLKPTPTSVPSSCPQLPSTTTEESISQSQQEMGKGVALHKLPPQTKLYKVEFKAARADYFYVPESLTKLRPLVGDLVIVEADRGKDLGNVSMCDVTIDQVSAAIQNEEQENGEARSVGGGSDGKTARSPDIHVKQIYRLAAPDEINMLLVKAQDEQRALAVCQQKVKQRKLSMDVVDAEYQWDRRKLTFYFSAERRIDFRELVRELFKTGAYKLDLIELLLRITGVLSIQPQTKGDNKNMTRIME